MNSLHWKETLKSLQGEVAKYGEEGRELVNSVSKWEQFADDIPQYAKSIAVFRSPETLHVALLHEQVPSRAELGPQFYIRPLLPELLKATTFYILALSQKNMRLLRCTLDSSEEVPLNSELVSSFDAYMNTAKPDHNRLNKTSAGVSSGSSKGIMGTFSTEREDKDEYLSHFFRNVDRAVNEVLRDKTEPLVPVGVEFELPLYRDVNTYPHFVAEGVQGAPNSLKAGEMHARAIQALELDYERKLDATLAEYDHKVGGGASNRLKDVVTAAHDGRVLTLIVSESLENRGLFDEATNQASGRADGDQDLVNDAVVQSILHAGRVLVAPNKKMPNGSPVAAIFRY